MLLWLMWKRLKIFCTAGRRHEHLVNISISDIRPAATDVQKTLPGHRSVIAHWQRAGDKENTEPVRLARECGNNKKENQPLFSDPSKPVTGIFFISVERCRLAFTITEASFLQSPSYHL